MAMVWIWRVKTTWCNKHYLSKELENEQEMGDEPASNDEWLTLGIITIRRQEEKKSWQN